MKFSNLALLVSTTLLIGLSASANSRYTCYAKCVVINYGSVPHIVSLQTLPPMGSNYSESTAEMLLQRECERQAGANMGFAVRGVRSLQGGESHSYQSSRSVSLSSGRSAALIGLYHRNDNSFAISNSRSESASADSKVELSDQPLKCDFNPRILQSQAEEYMGPARVGG